MRENDYFASFDLAGFDVFSFSQIIDGRGERCFVSWVSRFAFAHDDARSIHVRPFIPERILWRAATEIERDDAYELGSYLPCENDIFG